MALLLIATFSLILLSVECQIVDPLQDGCTDHIISGGINCSEFPNFCRRPEAHIICQKFCGFCGVSVDNIACDFQVDMCGWQSENTAWKWTRHQGASGKPNTGPTGDHNNAQDKYYAYLDGSSVQTPGALGRLTSPFVDSSDRQVCVDFYYHMFGYGVGNLTLKIKRQDGSEFVFWERTSDQGQKWNHAHVTLPGSSTPYQLVWEATRGPNTSSDVAIDDFNITREACPLGGDLGCGFELLTTCKWQQMMVDALDWQLQLAAIGGQSGGPPRDHTLQTDLGIYALVSGTSGEEAALNSIPLDRNSPFCLQLWYYIPNANAGQITIFREVLGNRLQTLRSIRYSGGQAGEWKHQAFTVNPFNTESNMAIVAQPQDTTAGPLAIDDVSLTLGSCP